MGKIRGTHSSPGIYTKITDLPYSAKSMGITTLGLVGETLKGPAFEPIMINSWSQFQDFFGSTSAAKFKDSQYPKYELPYIAKSYLSVSDQLYVCRVLGLSGYNAGPAWIITASRTGSDKKYVVAVLRSRGKYVKYGNGSTGNNCEPNPLYDTIDFACDRIVLSRYTDVNMSITCEANIVESGKQGFDVTALNYGQFTIDAYKGNTLVGSYAVSFNSGSKNYIYNVLGSIPTEGNAAVFVEEFYDYYMEKLISNGEIDRVDATANKVSEMSINPVCDPVSDFVTIESANLARKLVGQTFLYDSNRVTLGKDEQGHDRREEDVFYYYDGDTTKHAIGEKKKMENGYVYFVERVIIDNLPRFIYRQLKDSSTGQPIHVDNPQLVGSTDGDDTKKVDAVKVLAYNSYYYLNKKKISHIEEFKTLSFITDEIDNKYINPNYVLTAEDYALSYPNATEEDKQKVILKDYYKIATEIASGDTESVEEGQTSAKAPSFNGGNVNTSTDEGGNGGTLDINNPSENTPTDTPITEDSGDTGDYNGYLNIDEIAKKFGDIYDKNNQSLKFNITLSIDDIIGSDTATTEDQSSGITLDDLLSVYGDKVISAVGDFLDYDYLKTEYEADDTIEDENRVYEPSKLDLFKYYIKHKRHFFEKTDNLFVVSDTDEIVTYLTSKADMCDYREQFRSAVTPWFVSELKGSGTEMEVKKLFRFYTITDGNSANTEVKVSISNIRPDDGTFDLYVRDFDDSDGNQTILESYKNLTMVPGSNKYIGYQIGTVNGEYESRSKYVLVEVIENDITASCVPAGFLGYPVRDYDNDMIAPTFVYNTIYDDTIKAKKQYFGLSDITGVDVDMLYYKGKNAYTGNYTQGYTSPFHLDSTLNKSIKDNLNVNVVATIDGDMYTSGITWETVSPNNVTAEKLPPVIGSEYEMEGTIYEDINLRKFTVYFYGGFDGWDIYRNARTNTDEYKANKYKGKISNGYGSTFSKINDGTTLALSGNCITSDYYAYLAGINQFENTERYTINLFATPGIDYIYNNSLVNEALDMVENRYDTFYVINTPDKPYGATDEIDNMFSSRDVVSNLEDASIDTYYASTYYPWIKYYDSANHVFVNLSPTKDVLRNMADVDNKRYPWYAPAGIERGRVDCVKMHFFAKLEDEDNVYDGRINPLKTFSQDGVKVWGNKTMYSGDTPMNRINVVRLMLYMRKLIIEASRPLIFEPNDATLKGQFKSLVEPILSTIKSERGITDFRLDISQTVEEMDAHELSCKLWVKPTPTLEYIEINFMVTPQGVSFDE